MFRRLCVLFTLIFCSVAMAAEDGMISKRSSYGVGETLDRMEAVLEAKGVMVFSRIDHAAGAARIGIDLPPTQLLIFGNPKLGTPLMQSNRHIGIDLPLKVLAWQDSQGMVWLSYSDPAGLQQRYSIVDRDPLFNTITATLDKLTDKALSGELKMPSGHE